MTEQAFSLMPFPSPNVPDINISGWLSHENPVITLHYALTGSIDEIFIPPPSAHPQRKGELWKATCFEFFLAIRDQLQYWEFNMSPSGDWNAYRMDAYRRIGFGEEASIQRLQFKVERETDRLTLDAEVDLSSIFRKFEHMEIGITAILQTKHGNETYWALTHPAPQPDFHLRESFILRLAAQTHPLGQSAPGD